MTTQLITDKDFSRLDMNTTGKQIIYRAVICNDDEGIDHGEVVENVFVLAHNIHEALTKLTKYIIDEFKNDVEVRSLEEEMNHVIL